MPKKRPPNEVWNVIRKIIWERDSNSCVHCHCNVGLFECHIDHKQSGKSANNKFENLRTLCPKCHVLRRDIRHRGMIARALKKGLIPPNWRALVWEE